MEHNRSISNHQVKKICTMTGAVFAALVIALTVMIPFFPDDTFWLIAGIYLSGFFENMAYGVYYFLLEKKRSYVFLSAGAVLLAAFITLLFY